VKPGVDGGEGCIFFAEDVKRLQEGDACVDEGCELAEKECEGVAGWFFDFHHDGLFLFGAEDAQQFCVGGLILPDFFEASLSEGDGVFFSGDFVEGGQAGSVDEGFCEFGAHGEEFEDGGATGEAIGTIFAAFSLAGGAGYPKQALADDESDGACDVVRGDLQVVEAQEGFCGAAGMEG